MKHILEGLTCLTNPLCFYLTEMLVSHKMRSAQSINNLPEVLSSSSCGGRQYCKDGWLTDRTEAQATSDYTCVPKAAPWRPSTYFGSARLPRCDEHSTRGTGPVVNLPTETAKLYELEGLSVPSIYSAARNALYTRYTPVDWLKSHNLHLTHSDRARQLGEKLRADTVRLGQEANDRVRRAQEEVNKLLGDRINDVYFLRNSLLEETDAMVDEKNRLLESKRALEKCLSETENPLHITQECLYHREKRQAIDLVHDDPEKSLLRASCVCSVKPILTFLLNSLCRAVQHELEKDSADKFQAMQLDQMAHQLKSSSAGLALHLGVEKIDQRMSVPEKWAEHTAANLKRSQAERAASRKIREEIDHLLNSVSMRMRESWAMSSSAIAKRAQETTEARNQLQVQLTKVTQELFDVEKNMESLKKCIEAKRGPLQLAQTRLDIRRRRPNMELCRDDPHGRLILEVAELQETIDQLMQQLATMQSGQQDLLRARGQIEQDLAIKSNSLFIDREQCLGQRKTFPMTPSIIAPV
ncbi:putative cystoskeletal protein tektin [Paragonimus heterotremus]|uniref:Tektin n=1 Tax=Paragonimus heterotremus TaxID=100268 RepID=A0A8J4T3X0_9TREM|nr:putative cystoskeletal protein tektin [Paragonimus heterotremus]